MMHACKLGCLLFLLLAMPAAAQESCRLPPQIEALSCDRQEESRGRRGDFDHYILSFSWSPAWCGSGPAGRSPIQCRDNHFGWIVHGLWPQYAAARGIRPPWPQYCAAVAPVPPSVLRPHLCTMPDPRLMQCQWAKHGSCSGFAGPETYFAAIGKLAPRFSLPEPAAPDMPAPALRDAVLAANPGLERGHVQVIRNRGQIREIRICLDRSLENPVFCD